MSVSKRIFKLVSRRPAPHPAGLIDNEKSNETVTTGMHHACICMLHACICILGACLSIVFACSSIGFDASCMGSGPPPPLIENACGNEHHATSTKMMQQASKTMLVAHKTMLQACSGCRCAEGGVGGDGGSTHPTRSNL